MPSTHRIPHLTIAFAIAFALFAGFTATPAPARAQQAEPATTVPVSEYNARWPPEPASGPLPPAVVPAATPAEPRNHTPSRWSPACSCSPFAPPRRPACTSVRVSADASPPEEHPHALRLAK